MVIAVGGIAAVGGRTNDNITQSNAIIAIPIIATNGPGMARVVSWVCVRPTRKAILPNAIVAFALICVDKAR